MSSSDKNQLDISELSPDPVKQFGVWFAQASDTGQHEPETGCLATAAPNGQPSARMVLLKSFDSSGFVVFTNYGSRKACELEANPRAALTFYWASAGRQVRIEGAVERTSREESFEYFNSRPYESRLGAWASSQSKPLASREELLETLERFRAMYPEDRAVPLPEHWGGYRIVPEVLEFWQQGQFRLHDRFRYCLSSGGWIIARLYP